MHSQVLSYQCPIHEEQRAAVCAVAGAGDTFHDVKGSQTSVSERFYVGLVCETTVHQNSEELGLRFDRDRLSV